MASQVDVRRAAERFQTRTGWLDSRHSFSFSHHYDPGNTGFGLLLVSNDDVIAPGSGFQTHPHRDMEIVTWVLSGELEHKDSQGNAGIIYPGLAQRMSAGTGIWHSEMNARGGEPVHLVQMWVLPDTERIDPGYQQVDVNEHLQRGGLVPVAGGRGGDAAIGIRQRGASLLAGRLGPGETVRLPDAPYVHVFVATGSADLEGAGRLEKGDAVRLAGAGTPALTAGESGAEVLAWEMDEDRRIW
ncbi:MAG TPA: pirin family protein [Candidatus Dormibacteraeota bacterium]|jgi:redox-sensitive bicupin YhaK (pirin superfamily)|nr:pirin family protein [Candidatus Dormibacteraeota bacterium]